MKRILVPTDFSECASKAMDYAVCLAEKTGAEIILLHACEIIDYPFKDKKAMIDEHNQTLKRRAKNRLQELKRNIENSKKVNVSTHIFGGEVTGAIKEEALRWSPDLIVMGTVGRSGLRNKVFGSKTSAVISETVFPVVVVPQNYEWAEPKKILLVLNESELLPNELKLVFEMASAFDSSVTAAVFSSIQDVAVDVLGHSRSINSIKEKFSKTHADKSVKTEHLSGQNFQDAVLDYVRSNNMNLMVMITHKRSGIESLLNKSKTRNMSYHTTVPLLAIPA